MENKGIIISGGEFKAKNVIVGDSATIEVNQSTKSATSDLSKNTTLSEKIKALIKEGKIKEASEILFSYFKDKGDKAALNAMIMHTAALSQLEMQENLDILTHEQAKTDRAKVINAVLQLVDNQL
jgi:Effector-associated domain 11/Family of unknown function (DUF6483)